VVLLIDLWSYTVSIVTVNMFLEAVIFGNEGIACAINNTE
jgi:hypothetical protein